MNFREILLKIQKFQTTPISSLLEEGSNTNYEWHQLSKIFHLRKERTQNLGSADYKPLVSIIISRPTYPLEIYQYINGHIDGNWPSLMMY
jgi:hypothetical protein